jgi:Family of unknown function (DUF6165)
MSVKIEVSPGELIDKITILEIKTERINDPDKRDNVQLELKMLQEVRDKHIPSSDQINTICRELRTVNELLWDIEDRIRERERNKNFDSQFIELARSIYINNELRAGIKQRINSLLGSKIVEEKSYQPYE